MEEAAVAQRKEGRVVARNAAAAPSNAKGVQL